jgi:hypothetical protein
MQEVPHGSWKFKIPDDRWNEVCQSFLRNPKYAQLASLWSFLIMTGNYSCSCVRPLINFPTSLTTSTTSRLSNSSTTMDVCAQLQADDLGFGSIVSGFSYENKCEVPKLGSQQQGECWVFGGAKVFQEAVAKLLVQASRKEYSLAAKFVYAQRITRYQQICRLTTPAVARQSRSPNQASLVIPHQSPSAPSFKMANLVSNPLEIITSQSLDSKTQNNW